MEKFLYPTAVSVWGLGLVLGSLNSQPLPSLCGCRKRSFSRLRSAPDRDPGSGSPKYWARVKTGQEPVCREMEKKSQGVMGRELTKPTSASMCLLHHSALPLLFPRAQITHHPQNSEITFPHLPSLQVTSPLKSTSAKALKFAFYLPSPCNSLS